MSRVAVTLVPQLLQQCRLLNLPAPTTEHKFHPVRKWRFDAAFVEQRLALEIEGGVFIQGRHTRGATFELDNVKYAEAAILGWTVIRATPRQIRNGQAVQWIQRWLARAAQETTSNVQAAQHPLPHGGGEAEHSIG